MAETAFMVDHDSDGRWFVRDDMGIPVRRCNEFGKLRIARFGTEEAAREFGEDWAGACEAGGCPCGTVIAETPSMRQMNRTLADDVTTMLLRHGTVAVVRARHRGGWQDALVECREEARTSVIPWDVRCGG